MAGQARDGRVYSTVMALERLEAGSRAARLFGSGPAARLALLRALWPAAVGPEVARRTQVIGIENDVLRVRVADAGWRKALFRVYRDIIVRLRHSAGSLAPAKLGFIEGPVAEAPQPPPPPPTATPRLPPSVEAAAAAIDDAEIRQRFLETAARYIGRTQP
jgi:predicted nucleic acid-binding Zn ribbon protein